MKSIVIGVSLALAVVGVLWAQNITKIDPPSPRVVSIAMAIDHGAKWLASTQGADGGFYFSTVNPEINKAGEADGHFASYGTATADGLLAFRAAGVPDHDVRSAKAIQWLKDHHKPDLAPGFEGTAREAWGSGLRFYYACAISRAMPDLPVTLPPQDADGSFRNPNKMVKEDDPLIATAFAVHVLARL